MEKKLSSLHTFLVLHETQFVGLLGRASYNYYYYTAITCVYIIFSRPTTADDDGWLHSFRKYHDGYRIARWRHKMVFPIHLPCDTYIPPENWIKHYTDRDQDLWPEMNQPLIRSAISVHVSFWKPHFFRLTIVFKIIFHLLNPRRVIQNKI